MNTTQPISNRQMLKNIKKDLVLLLIQQVEQKNMTFETASEIAQFIQEDLTADISQNDFIILLRLLMKLYPQTTPTLLKYTDLYTTEEDKQIIEKIQNLVKKNKIEEAEEIINKRSTN